MFLNGGRTMNQFTRTELFMIADMLEMASEEFGNHISNDMTLDATEENIEFIKQMIAASDYPEDELILSKDKSTIYTTDWMIMNYLRRLAIAKANDLKKMVEQ